MVFWAPLLAVLLPMLPPAQDQDDTLGPKKVQVQNASYNKVPNTTRGYIADAKMGDDVTVLGYEGSFAKVKRADGTECYIARSALVAPEKFSRGSSNEKQKGEASAQSFEAGRFDEETQAKYAKDKGPQMQEAFRNVDRWEARQAWITQRATLSQRMDEFRKLGKLAEYTAVQ